MGAMSDIRWCAHPVHKKVKVARWMGFRQVALGSYAQKANVVETWQMQQSPDQPAKQLSQCHVPGQVMDMFCTADGIIASGLDTGSVVVMQGADRPLHILASIASHSSAVTAISGFDRRLDSGLASVAENGKISIASLETSSISYQSSVSCGSLRALSFLTPTTMITGGMSRRLLLVDNRSPTPALTSQTCESEILSLCAMPDSSLIVGGFLDGTISVWDLRRTKDPAIDQLLVLGRHSVASAVWSLTPVLARSPMMFSCGQDGLLALSDIRAKLDGNESIEEFSLEVTVPLNSVDLRPDSVQDLVMAADNCSLVQVHLP